MSNDALEGFPEHEMKRKAVRQALHDLNQVNLYFWKHLDGDAQNSLQKQLLHLKALCEEIMTSAETLLEADAEIVAYKARADKELRQALSLTADQKKDVVLEPYQSPILMQSGTLALFNALKLGATEADARAWTRMSRDWKMLLYSVRCAQDCIYRALLLVQGEKAGARASMATCCKDDKRGNSKPSRLMLERHIPGFCDWFLFMKGIRDELKRGLAVASDWTAGEHAILLSESYPDGDFVGSKNIRRLSLDFAAECLRMCIAAINAVHAELVDISRQAPADTLSRA